MGVRLRFLSRQHDSQRKKSDKKTKTKLCPAAVGSRLRIVLLSETLVAGAWTEREKMYHGGSFLKLADDNMDIQNPEAQNRELSGF